MERPLSLSATMNSRKRSVSVVLGFQWAWMVPAGTNRLSPACNVTGGLPSSSQTPVPDRTWKVIAAGCKCRGLIAPGAYCVSQTITSCPGVFGSSLFRSGAWVMLGLSWPTTDWDCSAHTPASAAMRNTLGRNLPVKMHRLGWSKASIARPGILARVANGGFSLRRLIYYLLEKKSQFECIKFAPQTVLSYPQPN